MLFQRIWLHFDLDIAQQPRHLNSWSLLQSHLAVLLRWHLGFLLDLKGKKNPKMQFLIKLKMLNNFNYWLIEAEMESVKE